MLRKKPCGCGYSDLETNTNNTSDFSLKYIWNPPSPKTIYCKITATPREKLNFMLNKRIYPEKLNEITEKVKNHLYSCCNCVYYNEDEFHCKFKNKYLRRDSICSFFEPFENV